MRRQEIVDNLCGLRRALETDGILQDDIALALLLDDVICTLGLDEVEREAVLGWDIARAVDEWKLAQVWPTVPVPATLLKATEVAAHPLAEVAATP